MNAGELELFEIAKEMVNHPSHYSEGRKYEPIDVIDDWGVSFAIGNAIKYLSRAGRKNDEIEDLKKAIWYINYEIEKLKQWNKNVEEWKNLAEN